MKIIFLSIMVLFSVHQCLSQWQTLIGDSINVLGLAVHGDTVLASTGQGDLYMSADEGSSWQAINGGLPSSYIYNIGVRHDGALLCTVGADLYLSTDWSNWSDIRFLGGMGYTMLIRGNTILVGADGEGGLHGSFDNGLSWSILSQGVNGQFSTSVGLRGDTILWSRYNVPSVLYTTDSGQTWMDDPAFSTTIFALSPDGIYAGSYWSVFNHADTGWVEYMANTQILDIKTAEGYVAAVGYGPDVHVSNTLQTQWWPIALPGGLLGANRVAISNGYLYVASYGVYRIPLADLVGVDHKEGHSDLLIYPNPSNDRVTIDWSRGGIRPVSISLSDLTGRLISSVPVSERSIQHFDLGGLSNGVYQLIFTTETGVFGERFVISR